MILVHSTRITAASVLPGPLSKDHNHIFFVDAWEESCVAPVYSATVVRHL